MILRHLEDYSTSEGVRASYRKITQKLSEDSHLLMFVSFDELMDFFTRIKHIVNRKEIMDAFLRIKQRLANRNPDLAISIDRFDNNSGKMGADDDSIHTRSLRMTCEVNLYGDLFENLKKQAPEIKENSSHLLGLRSGDRDCLC